jgi:uracil-DNA glycosylase
MFLQMKRAADDDANGSAKQQKILTSLVPVDEVTVTWETMETMLDPSWRTILTSEFTKDYFIQLKAFLQSETDAKHVLYPPMQHIYAWSTMTPFHSVKVVLLGQDPYHGPNQAHGLSFSVLQGIKPPPSLVNIYKSLASDKGLVPAFQVPKHGYLGGWAQQGVLLLNATLTVRKSQANSHSGKGWEKFTDALIHRLNQDRSNLVFLLWGAYAQKKGSKIDASKHLVLKAVHPSPLSAYKGEGFFAHQHFSKTNTWLVEHDMEPIDWNCLSSEASTV